MAVDRGAAVRGSECVGASKLGVSGVLAGRGWVSGCGAVLVDEPGAGGVSFDRLAWTDRDRVAVVVGCSLVETPVGSMFVVVGEVFVEEPAELALVADDGAIEEFVAEGAHPPFCERVGLW
jgi:hypothetical protein